MSELAGFFSTDWDAMTRADWSGLIIVLVLTLLMIGLYVWIFKPGNRDKFEQHRDFVNKEKEMDREVGHGQTR
ncbi:MAG: CcoQ/FixQ family Cbb3-type cytochrome c oxidase assembly chaperone [Mariprofundaceae bacterium]|nr:CcoQ/FixQ family Cbb3-type cytochrome c oxidase assembly chaperone [Mariprofundaceae bacterium]